MLFKYQQDEDDGEVVYVKGSDGHRYRVQMGFLSSPESLAEVQEYWSYGGRGSANWSMIILLYSEINWVSCPSGKNVCWESSVNSGQAVLTAHVYYRSAVWQSLINDYLAGGIWQETKNAYYQDIQKSIFDPICGSVPDYPTVGFIFTRVD